MDKLKPTGQVILYPSRKKWIAILTGTLLIVGVFLTNWFLGDGWEQLLVAALMALTLFAPVGNLIPGNSYLKLDDDDFEIKNIFRPTRRIEWVDVTRFKTVEFPFFFLASYTLTIADKGKGETKIIIPQTFGKNTYDLLLNMKERHRIALRDV